MLKNNPRNIKYIPVIIFFVCLDLEEKSSFLDGHELSSTFGVLVGLKVKKCDFRVECSRELIHNSQVEAQNYRWTRERLPEWKRESALLSQPIMGGRYFLDALKRSAGRDTGARFS